MSGVAPVAPPEAVVLFLPLHAMTETVDKLADKWKATLQRNFDQKIRFIVADVPFSITTEHRDKGYWLRPFIIKETFAVDSCENKFWGRVCASLGKSSVINRASFSELARDVSLQESWACRG